MNNTLDLFKLSKLTAIVSGASKGLGTVISEGLIELGISQLVILSRQRHGSLNAEKQRLNDKYQDVNIITKVCDVTAEDQVVEMVQELKKEVNEVNILVNNAGTTWNAPTTDQTLNSWNRVIFTNLTGSFLLTREIAREFMIPQTSGSIINISSLLALKGNAEISQIGYTASKSALLGLTRQLAIEWSPYKIRVNAIVPSFFEGVDSMANIFTMEGSPVRHTLLDLIPLRRFAQPEDLKAAVGYLASRASSFMTGQYLVLCGGMSIKS